MDFTEEFWKRREEEMESHKAHILMEVVADMKITSNDLTARQLGDPTAQRIRGWIKKIQEIEE